MWEIKTRDFEERKAFRITLYESFGEEYQKVFFDEKSLGFLVAHKNHGKNEYARNKEIGEVLAKSGECIKLLDNNNLITSADAERNGEIWEFKTITTNAVNLKNSVQRELRKGKKQAPNVLLHIKRLYTISEITAGIDNAVKFDKAKALEEIHVLTEDGNQYRTTRNAVLTRKFWRDFSKNKGG